MSVRKLRIRPDVTAVACPHCDAPKGSVHCLDPNGKERWPHVVRQKLARSGDVVFAPEIKILNSLFARDTALPGFLASGRNKINATSAGAIPSDDHNGLLPKLPGDLPSGGLGSAEVPIADASGGDNFDDKSRFAGPLPNTSGAESSHAGEALADLPVDHALHLVPRNKLAGATGNSGADVEPRGTNRRERAKTGHDVTSLSQARKKLEKRAGKDSRVYWILIDASSGEIEIETSWLPAGVLVQERKKNGHYVTRVPLTELAAILAVIGVVIREELS